MERIANTTLLSDPDVVDLLLMILREGGGEPTPRAVWDAIIWGTHDGADAPTARWEGKVNVGTTQPSPLTHGAELSPFWRTIMGVSEVV